MTTAVLAAAGVLSALHWRLWLSVLELLVAVMAVQAYDGDGDCFESHVVDMLVQYGSAPREAVAHAEADGDSVCLLRRQPLLQ
mmetsp:Transcript_8898/g.17409  ORF Transcript_8898/g.17409 Transcript_8898/m.17409 type:complete len:83 (+) Transcript_8898:62-310(+)